MAKAVAAALTVAALAAMNETQLKEEADRRGITVTGAEGGTPTEADYRKALAPTDTAAEAQRREEAKAQKLDQSPIKGGRYIREGTGTSDDNPAVFVNAYDQEINDDGTLKNKDEVSKLAPGAQPTPA